MNYRKTVLDVMNGKEVFPTPVDVFENGILPILGEKLMNYFGLKENNHEGLFVCLGASIRNLEK
jgi:hypothetical protein